MVINLKQAHEKGPRAAYGLFARIALLVIAALMIAPAEAFSMRREAARPGQSGDGKKKNDAERMAERLRKPVKRDSVNPPRSSRRRNTTPKAQARAASKTQGRLVVITGSSEAIVTVKSGGNLLDKGRSQGGRYEAELPAGEYDVEVESQEKTVYFWKAVVAEGHTQTLDAEQSNITPVKAGPVKTGAIIVEMSEIDPDVVVLLDGEKPAAVTAISETQIRLEDVPYGNHRLRFSHPSIKDLEWNVEVAAQSININPAFEVIAGRLVIRSEPGADIFIDGKRAGRVAESGETALYISPGRRHIKAEKDGYSDSEYSGYFGLDRVVIDLKLTRKKN